MAASAIATLQLANLFSSENLTLIVTLTASVIVLIIIIMYLSYKTGNKSLDQNVLTGEDTSSQTQLPVVVNIYLKN